MTQSDIFIIGAGPAGVATAIQLKKNGIKAIVLEKSEGKREKQCGGAIAPMALEIYSSLGLEYSYFQRKGKCVNNGYIKGFNKLLHGYTKDKKMGCFIEREILDWDFQQLAINRYKIPIRFGEKLVDLEVENDVIKLVAKKGSKKQLYFCKLLVAADGVTSKIRSKIFHSKIKNKDGILTGSFIARNFNATKAFIRFHEDKLPTYSWIFPYKNGAANIGIGIYKNVVQSSEKRDWKQELLLRMDIPKDIVELKPWLINTNTFEKRIYKRKIFFVGDAGGWVDSLTGEGISYALKSGISVAKTIKLMTKYGTNMSVAYRIIMFSSFIRLLFSKSLQL